MSGARDLTVGVTDLLRQPGLRRAVTRDVVLPGLGISTATVPEGAPVSIDLELEAPSDQVVVTGRITTPWVGSCRRCLEDVAGTASVEVRELFERRPTEGETYRLTHETIDLEPMVRDAVLLALPLAPLCSEGCRGPAPDEFPATVASDEPAALAEGGETGEREAPPADPRWAGLDQLKFD